MPREYRREQWEMDENPEGEIREMVELYKEKGVKEEDAEAILRCMAKYKDFFLSHMMNVELGLQVRSARSLAAALCKPRSTTGQHC